MAVYTTLTDHEIRSLLLRFALPDLQSFQGASSGVENTTYFLSLVSGEQYVLSIFENLSAQSLAPYIQLTTDLSQHGLPVPCPCTDKDKIALQTIAKKPALLFKRSPGKHIELVTPLNCCTVGAVLARIHRATASHTDNATPANPCGLSWMKQTLSFVRDSLDPGDIEILQNQIHLSEDTQNRNLPTGTIHGDLFRDNVLFENNSISAVIDFYNAGRDILLLDLAITANDWCYAQGALHGKDESKEKLVALLMGYQEYRPLGKAELASWYDCLQIAAARLWLSRQKRVVLAQQGGKGEVKDPAEYKSLLLHHLKASHK